MKKRILLIEDTRVLAENIADLLRMEDYEVRTASHGEEAVDMLRAGSFDVIISDLVMPEMDGFAFIRTVREDPRFSTTPIIVFTSLILEHEDVAFLHESGVNFVLSKSAEIEILLNSVSQVTANDERRNQGVAR